MYDLYSGSKKISNDGDIWKVFDGIEAGIAKTRKVSPSK